MSTEAFLLVLRLLSAIILLAVLATILVASWKNLRSIAHGGESGGQFRGRLVAVEELDDNALATGQTYMLRATTSLGRSPSNNVVVEDTFASSQHAVIVQREGQWWLEDRNSRNGTTLNGVSIQQPVVITDGDIIGIGKKLYRLYLE